MSLEQYMKHLHEAFKKDLFYLRPMVKVDNDGVWYSSLPVGKNKLATVIPEMCKRAWIRGHKTNHSLRATGATELYSAGVPGKIIAEQTGHRSLEALRKTSKKLFPTFYVAA